MSRIQKDRIFVVQEHHASHLHWDFRLEKNGVLKSWAVPKGPSINPSDKRLAIRVEDHSLDYADFEGMIEEGQYGAGEVNLWDKGTYKMIEEKDDKLEFTLYGKRLRGTWVLIKFKGQDKNWLLIKKKE